MVLLLLCTVPLLTGTFDIPVDEALDAAHTILIEQGIEIASVKDGKIITDITKMNVHKVNKYIEEIYPDDNPGWTHARYTLTITVSKNSEGQSYISIDAAFERFGVPCAFLLIPPSWISVPSNGKLEQEILTKIEKALASQGRAQ